MCVSVCVRQCVSSGVRMCVCVFGDMRVNTRVAPQGQALNMVAGRWSALDGRISYRAWHAGWPPNSGDITRLGDVAGLPAGGAASVGMTSHGG